MSLESELEIEVDQTVVEAGKQVNVLTMTSNELIGELWDIVNDRGGLFNQQREDYKKMVVEELKLRMHAHTL